MLAPGADTYTKKMKDLIEGWRSVWNQPDLPFEYALLAPMRYTWVKLPGVTLTEQSLPEFWDQQVNALTIRYTNLISTNDLVDPTGPVPGQPTQAYIMDLIHPGDKWDVAHRFALIALAKEYRLPDIVYSSPMADRVTRHTTTLQVDYKNAESGLMSRDGKPLTGFELADEKMSFRPASAQIEGTSVIVTSSAVTRPIAVRFGWNEVAQPNLVNGAGLPAIPFNRKISLPNSPSMTTPESVTLRRDPIVGIPIK